MQLIDNKSVKAGASQNCAGITWQCLMFYDVRELWEVSRKLDCRRRNARSFWKYCINWNCSWQTVKAKAKQESNLSKQVELNLQTHEIVNLISTTKKMLSLGG